MNAAQIPTTVLVFAWIGAYVTVMAALFAVLLGAGWLLRLVRNRKASR